MKLVVIGGHSRSVGKTGVACGLIAATSSLNWTALKITQYGHGICSSSGEPCGCAVEDPECPYAITKENGGGSSDTARMLQAGAREAYWVRAPMGRLALVLPDLEKLLSGRQHVLIESNSILEFWKPALYVSVLHYDVNDFKDSSRRFLPQADAVVVALSEADKPSWQGIESSAWQDKPLFEVKPPGYTSAEFVAFCKERLSRGDAPNPEGKVPRQEQIPAGKSIAR